MRSSTQRVLVRVIGGLLVVAGLLLWVGSAVSALSDPDAVTPSSDLGGRLVAWVLGGTLLMIAGLAVLQFESHDAELKAGEESEPPPSS